VTAVIHSA